MGRLCHGIYLNCVPCQGRHGTKSTMPKSVRRFSDDILLSLSLRPEADDLWSICPEIIRLLGLSSGGAGYILPSSWNTWVQSLTRPSSASLAEPWPATT
ncbi:hypothetical protein EB230_01085 [Mesorhizobium sp. NZP2234]|nr:hypothetical protein EB230_01085 [Mesorhizobium sp. NZP2234]